MKNKNTDLSEVSDDELARELARRRATKLGHERMLRFEEAVEQQGHADHLETMRQMLEQRSLQQDTRSKPCPKCGKRVPVRTKDRERTMRTMGGELSFRRHYHYCERCKHGFHPLDIALGLPEDGELSPQMFRRVLDFGVTCVFAEVPARWALHHGGSCVSENLVRLVVERAGEKLEAQDPPTRQNSVRSEPSLPPDTLVVQNDGSMLPMRTASEWKEVKVAVVYNTAHHLRGTDAHRGLITEPRYAASLRGIDSFRLEVDAALQAERALDAKRIAWVADGAPCNRNLCDELCPTAFQILDFMHMAEHASDCGKAVLGDSSPYLELWSRSIVDRIEQGAVHQVLGELREIRTLLRGNARRAVDDLIRYYQTNASRMDYPLYRSLLLPVASGAVESAHRHVIQTRMKLAGQHWSHRGAHRMALLRCAYKTAGPEKFADAVLPLAA